VLLLEGGARKNLLREVADIEFQGTTLGRGHMGSHERKRTYQRRRKKRELAGYGVETETIKEIRAKLGSPGRTDKGKT